MSLRNEDERLLFTKFPFSKPVSIKCRLRTRIVDYACPGTAQYALILNLSDNEANNQDEHITT